MSTHSSIDRDSFQTFLANSFAVQESGLDLKSLSALLEIQRFVGHEKFDLDGAIRMVADHALKVSSASGVAIALLEKGELVYRAGTGSAASDVGRRVPAVLSVTSARHEILRVENAGSDKRIEAEICRQFGAMSLLMLPIYRENIVAGVLQVVSDHPHHFDDREVRTYRLMIGALECGILRHAGPRTKEAPSAAAPLSDAWAAFPQNLESIQNTAVAMAAVADTARRETAGDEVSSRHAGVFEQPGTRAWNTYRTLLVPHRHALLAAMKDAFLKRSTAPWSAEIRHSGAVLGIALALSTAVWITFRDDSRRSAVPSAAATLGERQKDVTQTSEKTVSGASGEQKIAGPVLKGFRRVRVGPHEVDEIADDVTIRHYEGNSAKPLLRTGMKEVRFGEDVTVHYFPDGPVTVSEPAAVFESGSQPQTPIQAR